MTQGTEVRVLGADDVRVALSMEEAILAQREAFGQLASGEATIPQRTVLETVGGSTLFMPGLLPGPGALGLKAVSVVPANRDRGLPTVPGAILLLDPETGLPTALMDATYLTALRTAAGSGLAIDLLANPEAHVLTVFGAGTQAREHIRAARAVRPVSRVRVVSRTASRAQELVDSLDGVAARVVTDPAEAVRGAHLILAATNSPIPVFDGAHVEAGAHVGAVGAYTPETREVDEDVVGRARIVVDTREGALEEAGDLLIPMRAGLIGADAIDAELGEIVNGTRPAGSCGRDITFYKSVGNAAQDLSTARRVMDAAIARGLGAVVAM